MKNMTVTAELRKSINKVMKKDKLMVFSDCRLDKKAVGVKVVRLAPNKKQINSIVNDMESKGFELAYVKENFGGYGYCGNVFSGTRFCFYKLNYSNIK